MPSQLGIKQTMECVLYPIPFRTSLPCAPSAASRICCNYREEKKKKSGRSPTALHPTTNPLSRSHVLDVVLRDLETSISDGVRVDASTFSSFLESCFQTAHFSHGLRLHRLIPSTLLRRSADLSSKLLRLYSACGLMEDAHRLFDEMPQRVRNRTAFPWNSLISGYVESGQFEDAMALYYQMEEEGVEPDCFTFPRVLKACAGLGSIAIGEAVHRHTVRTGYGMDPFVLNALVDMYAKCGDIDMARRVFHLITQRDQVSWNSMVAAYARHGMHLDAVNVCKEMLVSGFDPDSVSLSTLLSGVSDSGLGREIHGWVLRHGLESYLSVANALIAMYSECNDLKRARIMFELIQEKDVVSWNTIISAHRRDKRALVFFKNMRDSGVLPDHITFVSLLSACSNLGLVQEGRELFVEMEEKYRIIAGMEHFSCIVNMLGRAGLIDEAYEFIMERVPHDGGPTVWGALLYACSLHGNVNVGEVAAERLLELEPDNGHNFELMMEIYKRAGRDADVDKMRRMREERGLDS